MQMLTSEAINPVVPDFTFLAIVYGIAIVAIWLLLMWLIIYSAVRAALTSHRRAMAADAEFARRMAEQRGV